MIRNIVRRSHLGALLGSAAALALVVCATSGAMAQRGGRFGGGGGRFGGGFGHSGGIVRPGIGHPGGSHFVGHFGGHIGPINHGHFFHGGHYYGGTSVFFGLGFGSGYYYPGFYYPSYWNSYPYWYPDSYPVYVPDPYPVYVTPPTPAAPAAPSSDNDYYLYRRPNVLPKDPELTATIADIEESFRDNDIVLLKRHVADEDTIGFRSYGRSREAFKGSEYLDKTRDAYKSLKTVKFELTQAEPAGRGDWLVSGTHVFKRDDGKETRFAVSFLLHKSGDRWLIREVSADALK